MARALAAAGVTVALTLALFALAPTTLWSWDARTTDLLFHLRSRVRPPQPSDAVVHVDISDSSLTEMGTSEVSRAELARVIRTLAAAGARAQALDFVFPGRDTADPLLIAAVGDARSVFVGEAPNVLRSGPSSASRTPHLTVWNLRVEGSADAIPLAAPGFSTFAALRAAAAGTGFLNLSADTDGVYRRAPMLLRVPGGFTPSLTLRVAAAVLEVPPERIVVRPGRTLDLLGARRGNLAAFDLRIPIDDEGRTRINFVDRWEDGVHLRFVDALNVPAESPEIELWRREVGGRVVLIADTSTGSADSGAVPIDARLPLAGVHAALLTSLLTGSFVYEPSPLARIGAAVGMAGAALLLALFVRSYWYLAAVTCLSAAYLSGVAVIFLRTGWILPILPPVIAVGLFTGFITASRYVQEQKTRTLLRRSFESYFAPPVVDKILRNPAAVLTAIEKKELSVLFSDIEGFTLRSSSMPPGDVRDFLNDYFDSMVRVVFSFGGTVDKFIGDGLMVFFGDPLPQPDHASRAVACAVTMQRELASVNERLARSGRPPIHIRVGIASGEVVVGNMGSAQRLSYTVLGATVNLAQRLESQAPAGGVLISETTYRAMPDDYGAVARPPLIVKGFPEPLAVYEISPDAVQRASVAKP